MSTRRNKTLCAIATAVFSLLASNALAQTYPSQTIRIIVPTPAGGIADLAARTLAQKLTEAGKTAVVENQTGGAGAIAATTVARASPDGHTLLIAMHQTNAILPHLASDLKYDGIKDFSPITNLLASGNILVINPSLPVKTVRELVQYAKGNPGKVTYASQGNGSSGHIAGELFKMLAGIDITHVPYRGAAPAAQDLVAGHVSMMFDIVPLAKVQIESGKLIGLGIATNQRLDAVPNVPTMLEAGFPTLQGGPWFGLAAPAGTPRPIIDLLNSEARKAFAVAEVRQRFESQGMTIPLSTPEEFGSFIQSEHQRWGKIIRDANIKIQP